MDINLEVNLEGGLSNSIPERVAPIITEIESDEDDGACLGQTQNTNNNAKRSRKTTSAVWAFFEKGPIADFHGKYNCTCKRCGQVLRYSAKTGTGNLKRHVDNCSRKDTRDIGQLLLNHDISLRSSAFDPAKFRELLTGCMVRHDYPLSFVEHDGLRAVFSYLRENTPTISRNTEKADLMRLYAREKIKMKQILADAPGRISLTSDLWTSIATDGYISLTAHFVDKNWVLQKKIINFNIMSPPHNAIELNNKISSLVHEWGIESKLFSITLDNASANNSFVGLLKIHLNMKKYLVAKGIYLHQRCCAHIINLIVQEGLKVIDESVEKVRETAKYVKGSQVRKQKFIECVNYASLNLKRGLRQDVPTRWNSTFLMLDSGCYFRSALLHLKLSDSNYTSCPTEDEWQKLEKIKKFLATFYEVTRIFSGVKYPTANLYFPAVFKAYAALRNAVNGDDDYLKVMASKMVEKFDKYWNEFSIILCIAVVLDPRYKLQLVVWSYEKMYGGNSSEFERVRNALYSLFDEYKITYEQLVLSKEVATSTSLDDDSLDIGVNDDVLEGFDYFDENEYELTSKKTELESYLEEKRVDRRKDLDVIEHWRNDELRYPILARMARDILSIPISTVASESAFSGGGRVLDQYRSTLRPEVVEALMCCKDWLYGEKESKEISIDDIAQDVIKGNQPQEEEGGNVTVTTNASETAKV